MLYVDNMRLFIQTTLLALSAITMIACGGGGGTEPPPAENSTPEEQPPTTGTPPPLNNNGYSLRFNYNDANSSGAGLQYDFGRQLNIPAEFGTGEFTFELWIKADDSFPFGATNGGVEQRTNWTNIPANPQASDGYGWWYKGNFLLDGHANAGNSRGTFSLQFYGGGRLRWHFYDSAGEWFVQALNVNTAPNVVDGNWHKITLVRRWVGSSDAQLELWIDAVLIAQQTSSVRENMRTYWDTWAGFATDNEGWFWGTEKLAAIDYFDQYEDYKGLIDELRLWNKAKSELEIQNSFQVAVTGSEEGLVGLFQFNEGTGTASCNAANANAVAENDCINLTNMKDGYWVNENAF